MGFYRSIHDRISARPGLCRVLEISVKLLPGLVYGAYPLMLLGLLLFRRELLLRAVLVPAAGLLIAACAAVIAVTALKVLPPLGAVLWGIALLIALTRVLSGVHFVRDVVCGLLLGGLIGWVGMYGVP